MTKSRGILSQRRKWTADEEQILCDLYPDIPCADIAALLDRKPSGVYQAAHRLGLEKSEYFKASESSGRIARGRQHPNVIATRFQSGQIAWNRGIKGVVGVQDACRRTQFKAGQKPHNTKPIGSYRLNKEGHLQQKIGNAKGSNSKRWRTVAELVWCAANGPLASKHIVVFKPGLFTNKLEEITLDRIECVSNAQHALRNSIWRHDPELVKLYQLKGAITRQVNRIKESKNVQSTH